VPIVTTVRDATPGERGVIARRTARRHGALSRVNASRKRELITLGVVFAAGAIVCGVFEFRAPSPPLAFAVIICAVFAIMTLVGLRNDRQRLALESNDIARAQVARAQGVTAYRLAVDRIVVASGPGDDGDVWWCFRADDGRWLVLERDQWEDLDPSAQTWHRDVTVGVDAHRAVVSVASTGAPVTVQRRDLQPPDYMPTPRTLFWAPPEDVEALPAILSAGPEA